MGAIHVTSADQTLFISALTIMGTVVKSLYIFTPMKLKRWYLTLISGRSYFLEARQLKGFTIT